MPEPYTLHLGYDRAEDVEYLLTTWTESGDVELAVRPKGARRWGPPVTLRPEAIEQVAR